jgi:hypothetical protein
MKLLTFVLLVIIAVGAYWYLGPISPSDAPYWSKINSSVPEKYRKPEHVPAP